MPDWLTNLNITFQPFTFKLFIELLLFILLLIFSALISGSEVAFFSLTPQSLSLLKNNENEKKAKLILKLLENPDKLLATILISNNFVNIGIVILSTYINKNLIDFHGNENLKFIYEVVVITFLILLF